MFEQSSPYLILAWIFLSQSNFKGHLFFSSFNAFVFHCWHLQCACSNIIIAWLFGLIPDFLCHCIIIVPQWNSCQHSQTHSSHWFVIKTVFPSLFITWSVLFDKWNDSSLQLKQSFSKLTGSIFLEKNFWKKFIQEGIVWVKYSSTSTCLTIKVRCSQSSISKLLPWRLNYRLIMYL